MRKIETELRKQLDPSTVCDVKVNNHGQSVLWKQTLMTECMLSRAKLATQRSLSKDTDDSVDSV